MPQSPPDPDDISAFMHLTARRLLIAGYVVLATNLAVVVQRFMERQWFGMVAQLAVAVFVGISLPLIHKLVRHQAREKSKRGASTATRAN
jgi:uncharacterized membrane-anchored protein